MVQEYDPAAVRQEAESHLRDMLVAAEAATDRRDRMRAFGRAMLFAYLIGDHIDMNLGPTGKAQAVLREQYDRLATEGHEIAGREVIDDVEELHEFTGYIAAHTNSGKDKMILSEEEVESIGLDYDFIVLRHIPRRFLI